jgi:hypothetical protein
MAGQDTWRDRTTSTSSASFSPRGTPMTWKDSSGHDARQFPKLYVTAFPDLHLDIEQALAADLGMRPLVAHCHFGLGTLYRQSGQREQAQEHLTTATTLYREMDMRFWLAQAEAELTGVGDGK